ncbi:hypothetical protein MPH61_06950 [Peribacillus muralis]|uniref:hypothetical protein n=1 Tax=Peribacillus muralis TaxID=264697 RepID=UPI001F4E87E5|nr:hypothetical protein [Peribacillus muralis]MCK1992333.1 hypothetical protein [Peribacillus muralis]MCK2012889.1 hypothetical protein [Peribacillus muralis]
MEHEFYLTSKTIDIKNFWMYIESSNNVIDCVVIHDDLIQYIMDSLEWIPSKNPALRGIPSGKGINYYGVTLFEKDASKTLISIFSSWKSLFKNAPKKFELTGAFIDGENGNQEGNYERLVFSRDEVITQFEKIISMSETLAAGEFYLYHCGI